MANTLLYTIPQVAEALTCSRPHVYALISSGRLKSVDISTPTSSRTKLRVRHLDLLDFLEGGSNGHGPAPEETTKGAGPTRPDERSIEQHVTARRRTRSDNKEN